VYSLEHQIVEVKLKHPDLLLFVEGGYNFRFVGEDADLAQELPLILFDHNLNTASIPSVRLTHHVDRLVRAGHKD
jgi:DNA mismatch repair protein MSH3